MSRYNEIDYARDLIRWMEAGQKIRDRGVAAGFELPHSLAKLPETATPPLAPCEPSAEPPTLKECDDAYWKARDGAEGQSTEPWLAGLAAVRALFVKEKLT